MAVSATERTLIEAHGTSSWYRTIEQNALIAEDRRVKEAWRRKVAAEERAADVDWMIDTFAKWGMWLGMAACVVVIIAVIVRTV